MIKMAVIGIGYVGFHHARILSSDPRVKLIAISDIDENKSHYANIFSTKFINDYLKLPDDLNAVVICTPTTTHSKIAEFFLNNNKHIFVEKPLTDSLDDAIKLINLAEKKNLIVQVGLIEKYNPAFLKTKKNIKSPRFIQAIRQHPFINRCLDVDVIIDLMIHDLDLILTLLNNYTIIDINAHGSSLKTNLIDTAYACITFSNKCICQITSSRVGVETKRTMNIFLKDAIYSLNFAEQSYTILSPMKDGSGKLYLHSSYTKNNKKELLPLELNSFIQAIQQNNTNLINSAKNTLKSLELATKIRNIISKQS